jgi:hypothetical protein
MLLTIDLPRLVLEHCISFSISLLRAFQIELRSRNPRTVTSATMSWHVFRMDCATVCGSWVSGQEIAWGCVCENPLTRSPHCLGL